MIMKGPNSSKASMHLVQASGQHNSGIKVKNVQEEQSIMYIWNRIYYTDMW